VAGVLGERDCGTVGPIVQGAAQVFPVEAVLVVSAYLVALVE
jgi:hypothetical protein